MFTQPVSSPPPGPQTASPISPSRPSRLRGLSYLRNYTQNHLLSRDSHANGANAPRSSGGGNGNNLTRSVSYTPTSNAATNGAATGNRLTLVSSTPNSTPPRANADTMATATHPPIAERPNGTQAGGQAETPQVMDGNITNGDNALAAISGETPGPVSSTPAGTATGGGSDAAPASIRLSAYYDPRSTRPSLSFPPITRTLPNGTEVIRVGRYSERDGQAANMAGNQPSANPIGFKSKVVSRRHCEFWCEDGKWYIRDVKSSSGTFLNHIRLSAPSQESKPYPVNDGDIVQLGIDFKGGEEMIFRCVKMRLELNRGWQNKLNSFNVAAHKRLRTMASTNNAAASAAGSSSQDCSICLNSIAPCQSLFVAPCSHTWHFKCVRSLLISPQYPIFVCPNCRAGADLEADVEEPSDDWQQLEDEEMDADKKESSAAESIEEQSDEAASDGADASAAEPDPMDVTVSVSQPDSPAGRSNSASHSTTEPLPIRNPASGSGRVGHLRGQRSPSPSSGAEGPITPRNNAGPWVFDGGAGGRDGVPTMSLDAAADMDVSQGQSDEASR